MGIKTIEDGVIIPAIYDFVECISDGLFHVTEADSHAYFNLNGKKLSFLFKINTNLMEILLKD